MPKLTDLCTDSENEKRILKDSCMFGCTLEIWTEQRKFIAEAIDRSGTILDIGCANGLLLRSLIEWSQHKLIPYGIDPNQERLDGVAEVLPECKNNFAPLRITQLEQLENHGLPEQFDLVFWNVWDDFDPQIHQHSVAYTFNVVKPGGRLILGFYHENSQGNDRKIAWFKEYNPNTKGFKDNLPNTQCMIWYDL